MEPVLARIKSVEDLDVAGKRVLLRADLNCPVGEDGVVTDDTRIVASLPTIKLLRQRGAKVIICSHLGRPKGRPRKEFSLQNVGARLAELLGQEILFPDDCIGDGPRKLAMNLREGQVMLLENVRFHPGETANDPEFARALASLAQVYVDDAFGAAHREHASVVGAAHLIGDRGAGLLLIRELEVLGELLRKPERPFVVVMGGAKVSGKIGAVENLLHVCDSILIGGAMSYTFLAALGVSMGKSPIEEDKVSVARRVLTKAEAKGVEILLPSDHICAPELAADAPVSVHATGAMPPDLMALDIGPETAALMSERIVGARTVFWNGPMGVFEMAPFSAGTLAVAHAVAKAKVAVVGGGDSAAALRKAGVTPFITHISTGGGASLEFLEGRELPGVEALRIGRKVPDVV